MVQIRHFTNDELNKIKEAIWPSQTDNKMQPKAVNNFVFIIQDKAEEEKSGLLIPGTGREKPHKGIIFSVGDCVQDNNIKTSEGKQCLFHKGSGFHVEHEGIEYLVLTGEQVIAIV